MKEIDWKVIRSRSGIIGPGNGRCKIWCYTALKDPLVATLYSARCSDLSSIGRVNLEHWFLTSGRKIADGTAGQYDPRYPEGFYGDLYDASQLLISIYLLGVGI